MSNMDSISKKVLLRYHYRCDKEIVKYSNLKYYGNQLLIKSPEGKKRPLKLYNVKTSGLQEKNISIEEVNVIEKIVKERPNEKIGVITPFRAQASLLAEQLKNYKDVTVGTVHKFQGSESDVTILSSAITPGTHSSIFDWLKNNRQLINVATTRAKKELIVAGDYKEIKRQSKEDNDFLELCNYVHSKGKVKTIRRIEDKTKVLKPYQSYFEDLFQDTLKSVLSQFGDLSYESQVKVSRVIKTDNSDDFGYFNSAEFDFVLYVKPKKPVAVFELDGIEHQRDEKKIYNDQKKKEICSRQGIIFQSIPNSYARRYDEVKSIIKKVSKKI